MNNLSSYCGLVDAKIRASDKDLLVCQKALSWHNKAALFFGRPRAKIRKIFSLVFGNLMTPKYLFEIS